MDELEDLIAADNFAAVKAAIAALDLSEIDEPHRSHLAAIRGGINRLAGMTPTAPLTLERAKARALSTVELVRDQKIAGGIYVAPYGIFLTKPSAMQSISGKALRAVVAMIEGDAGWTADFQLLDGNTVSLDPDSMIIVGKALDQHVTDCYARSWAFNAEIAAAETLEDVAAIDIQSDWPEPTEPEIEPEP